jgi:hypothetical protein
MLASRPFRWIWILAALLACGFLCRIDLWRIERVTSDSLLYSWGEIVDASSPTGLAHAQRNLIVPERNEDSLQWIMQTQQMLAQHQWRVRHVDYDNAPAGRNVSSTSPYRWWLGAVSCLDHAISGRPIGLAVTHAALYADPLLQIVGLLLLTGFAASAFDGFAAILFALGFAALFPFATGFQPGAPDDRGLAALAALSTILVVLWALRASGEAVRKRWIIAGVVGGIALWISLQTAVPALLGIFLAGVIAAFARKTSSTDPLPAWRAWSYAGAAATVLAWLLEYAPSHLGNWNIEFVHPLYALAWLGLGEILAQLDSIRQQERKFGLRSAVICLFGLATLVPIAVIMLKVDTRGFLAVDLLSHRLTKLPDSPFTSSTWAWLLHDGAKAKFAFTLLPVLSALLAIFAARRSGTVVWFVVGPLLLALGFAMSELTFWSAVDGVVLASICLFAGEQNRATRLCQWIGIFALLFAVGGDAWLAWPGPNSRAGATLTAADAQLLIERDLAHWLAQRTGYERAVVLASPRVTMSQSFYGNLRGIGTVNTDNRGGLGATIAIVSATTMEEAQTLMAQRQVSYLVIPSWDPFFEDYTHLYLAKSFAGWHPFFIPQLRQWHLPPWLRPVPFEMPPIGGYEDQSVLVFQVVPDQNPAVAASRLGEYFVESGRTADLTWADDALRRFPADVGALAARAQIAASRNDENTTHQIMETLGPRLRSGGDRFLPWDRRVSLAIALARGGQTELAQVQTKRCIQEMDLPKARTLSTGLLYNLLVVANAFHISVENSDIIALLSPDLREQLTR